MSRKVSAAEVADNQSRAVGAGLVHCEGCPADAPKVDPDRNDGLCSRHYHQTVDTMGASMHLNHEEW